MITFLKHTDVQNVQIPPTTEIRDTRYSIVADIQFADTYIITYYYYLMSKIYVC